MTKDEVINHLTTAGSQAHVSGQNFGTVLLSAPKELQIDEEALQRLISSAAYIEVTTRRILATL